MKQFFKSRKEAVLLVSVLLIHLVLLSSRLTQAKETPLLRGWAVEVVAPFLKGAVGGISSVSNAWNAYIDLRKTYQENQRLRGLVEEYRKSLIQYEERMKELERLKTLGELKENLVFPS